MQVKNVSKIITDYEVDFVTNKGRAFLEAGGKTLKEVYDYSVTYKDEGDSLTDGTNVIIATEVWQKFLDKGYFKKDDFLFYLEATLRHENAHILFTNFYSRVNYFNTLSKYKQSLVNAIEKWILEGKPQEIYDEIASYWKEIQTSKLKLNINNILEDGYIERRASTVDHRSRVVISHLRQAMIKYHLDQNKQLIKDKGFDGMDGQDAFSGLMGDIYVQATSAVDSKSAYPFMFGEGFDKFTSKYITSEDMYDIAVLCQYTRYKAVNSGEVWAATLVVSELMSEIYWNEFIKPSFDDMLAQKEADYHSLVESLENALNEDMPGGGMNPPEDSYIPPSISISSGPVSGGDIFIPEGLMDKLQQKAQEENEKQDQNSSDGNSENEQQEQGSSKGDSQSESSSSDKASEQDASEQSSGEQSPGDESSSSSEQSDSKAQSSKESYEQNKETIDAAMESGKDSVEKAIKDLAERDKKVIEDDLKKSEVQRVNTDINSIKEQGGGSGRAPAMEKADNGITDLNRGVRTKFHDLSGKYTPHSSELDNIQRYRTLGNKMSQPLKRALINRDRSKYSYGRTSGPEIDPVNVYRQKTDNKIFSKAEHPKKHTTIIGILVDMSGSMHGSKLEDAKNATYMLATALQKLNIRFQIWGHNTEGWDGFVKIVEFVPFHKSNQGEKYLDSIYQMRAGGANHDSVPIYKMLKELAAKKKADENAMLWVISDGAPAGIGNYQGERAMKDITQITELFEKRKKVKTVGIGIGRDTYHVPHIYKNSVIVEETEELPKALIKLLKDKIL